MFADQTRESSFLDSRVRGNDKREGGAAKTGRFTQSQVSPDFFENVRDVHLT